MKISSLTNEQKILLKLTARSLSDSPDFALTEDELRSANWEQIKEQSMAQAVALVAYNQALNFKQYIPTRVLEDWNDYAMANYGANFRIMQEQNQVLSLIKDKYKYAIIKGLSAGQYYPNPTLRAQGDIDFLIEKEKLQELKELFVSDGYKKLQEDHPNHVLLKKGFAQVEMHFEVTGIPHGEIGQKIRDFLSGVLDESHVVKHDMCEFNVPNQIHHALVLLLHMQHHMLVEGIGVRHLYDWGAFVKATIDKSFWSELIAFLDEIGLLFYAKVITRTCTKYIGSPLPNWAIDADEHLCDQVIKDIIDGGNFGRNDKNRNNLDMFVPDRNKQIKKQSKTKNLMHSLHKEVMKRYTFIKKIPIVYPFLFIYRAIRYSFLSLIGKRPSLIKTGKQANQRQKLYDKLCVFKKQN